MPFLDPKTIRDQFSTAAARDAFDRLHALGKPRWFMEKEKDGVFLSPDATTKKPGTCGLVCLTNCFGKTIDEAVMNLEQTLLGRVAEEGTVVVINAYESSRKEFTYDKTTRAFVPYTQG